MACFMMNITETQQGFATVEAENKEASEAMALELYNNGRVVWTQNMISEILYEERSSHVIHN